MKRVSVTIPHGMYGAIWQWLPENQRFYDPEYPRPNLVVGSKIDEQPVVLISDVNDSVREDPLYETATYLRKVAKERGLPITADTPVIKIARMLLENTDANA